MADDRQARAYELLSVYLCRCKCILSVNTRIHKKMFNTNVSVGVRETTSVSLNMVVYLLTILRCDQYRNTEVLYETSRLWLSPRRSAFHAERSRGAM